VIQQGELPGFGPYGTPVTSAYAGPTAWVSGERGLSKASTAAEVARLKREGFTSALVEQLGSSVQNWAGLSWVMQLSSAASARAELAANLSQWRSSSTPSAKYVPFAVPTIPGAHGFSLGGSGDNVIFPDGPYLYLVGDGWSGTKQAPPRAVLLRAALTLYRRGRA